MNLSSQVASDLSDHCLDDRIIVHAEDDTPVVTFLELLCNVSYVFKEFINLAALARIPGMTLRI